MDDQSRKEDRKLMIIMGSMMLTAIGIGLYLFMNIHYEYNTHTENGVVTSSRTYDSRGLFGGGGNKCVFYVAVDSGTTIDCGGERRPCPGTAELCNRLTAGALVTVVYKTSTRTDTHIFGTGEPQDPFLEGIISIQPRPPG